MRNVEFWTGFAYDRLYIIKVGATPCGRPKSDNQKHPLRRAGVCSRRKINLKSHRFYGGLWVSRPTFVSPRKLRISFPILRHGFAVPPPLPKEANAAESRGAGLLLILSANKTKSGVSEDTPPAIQLNSCANSIK